MHTLKNASLSWVSLTAVMCPTENCLFLNFNQNLSAVYIWEFFVLNFATFDLHEERNAEESPYITVKQKYCLNHYD